MWKWLIRKIDIAIGAAVSGAMFVLMLWLLEARVEIYIGN